MTIETAEKTCPNCHLEFKHRRFQTIITCPHCKKRTDARADDRHRGAGIFVRIGEDEKDQLERLAHEHMRSQADLLREAIALLFEKWGITP